MTERTKQRRDRKGGLPLPGLRWQRQLSLMRQDELADAAGVARATVGELEREVRGAQPRTVKALAQALEVEPQTLIEPPPRIMRAS